MHWLFLAGEDAAKLDAQVAAMASSGGVKVVGTLRFTQADYCAFAQTDFKAVKKETKTVRHLLVADQSGVPGEKIGPKERR